MRQPAPLMLLLCLTVALTCGNMEKSATSIMNKPVESWEPARADTAGRGCEVMTPSKDSGVGPIRSVAMGPVNGHRARAGETVFKRHCSHCHSFTAPEIGPSLGDAAAMRTAEYLMNMIVNPQGMEEQDSVVKSLVRCYGIKMPPLGLDSSQARAAVEFLRSVNKKE